jgi:osmotically-inducible protein OsmY
MKTMQSGLQQQVQTELEWEPGLDSSRIGVFVEKGVVSLTGHVRSLPERNAAERAVKRVRGVTAVANELQVDLLDADVRDDVQIARTAQQSLLWNIRVPAERIKVTVRDGWITLEGTVSQAFERLAAERAVEHLAGVVGVTNRIELRPEVSPRDVRHRLTSALHRYAQLEASGIEVESTGGKIVLRGHVSSWAERDLVQEAAWSAPGVTEVDNLLVVE